MRNLIKIESIKILVNITLLIFLFIGIQNSGQRKRIDFYFSKSEPLPLSFILGISFIVGSISSSLFFLSSDFNHKYNYKDISN